VKVIKVDEPHSKTTEQANEVSEDCPTNHESEDDLAAKVTELLKEMKKKPRSGSVITARSFLKPYGPSPHSQDYFRYRSYVQPQGIQIMP